MVSHLESGDIRNENQKESQSGSQSGSQNGSLEEHAKEMRLYDPSSESLRTPTTVLSSKASWGLLGMTNLTSTTETQLQLLSSPVSTNSSELSPWNPSTAFSVNINKNMPRHFSSLLLPPPFFRDSSPESPQNAKRIPTFRDFQNFRKLLLSAPTTPLFLQNETDLTVNPDLPHQIETSHDQVHQTGQLTLSLTSLSYPQLQFQSQTPLNHPLLSARAVSSLHGRAFGRPDDLSSVEKTPTSKQLRKSSSASHLINNSVENPQDTSLFSCQIRQLHCRNELLSSLSTITSLDWIHVYEKHQKTNQKSCAKTENSHLSLLSPQRSFMITSCEFQSLCTSCGSLEKTEKTIDHLLRTICATNIESQVDQSLQTPQFETIRELFLSIYVVTLESSKFV